MLLRPSILLLRPMLLRLLVPTGRSAQRARTCGATVGMASGTKRPPSSARPASTAASKDRPRWPPRVLEYNILDIPPMRMAGPCSGLVGLVGRALSRASGLGRALVGALVGPRSGLGPRRRRGGWGMARVGKESRPVAEAVNAACSMVSLHLHCSATGTLRICACMPAGPAPSLFRRV